MSLIRISFQPENHKLPGSNFLKNFDIGLIIINTINICQTGMAFGEIF